MSLKLVYQILLVVMAIFAFGDLFDGIKKFLKFNLVALALVALAAAMFVQSCTG